MVSILSGHNPRRAYLMDFLTGGSNLRGFFPISIIGPVIGALLVAFFSDRNTAE